MDRRYVTGIEISMVVGLWRMTPWRVSSDTAEDARRALLMSSRLARKGSHSV